MRNWKKTANFLSHVSLMGAILILSSCVADQSVSKKRGLVKDFSVSDGSGCDTKYLKYITPFDTCTTACTPAINGEGGYHLASAAELKTIKATLTAESNTSLLKVVNTSAGLCIPDIVDTSRPTDAIEINANFCSCVNGKADIINNCDSFCATKPVSDQPILYVDTTPGTTITGNTKIGNLYNWCMVQLESDTTAPQCILKAVDEFNNAINIPVELTSGSNSFRANINNLSKNRTWILKLVENKSSNAQSKSFQVHRKEQTDGSTQIGALEVTPLNQYTCLNYGFTVSNGVTSRDMYARKYYYYTADEMPGPVAPATPAITVCHDEILNPGADNIIYNRLENIPGALSLWNKDDSRFVVDESGKEKINTIIQTRLANEYQVSATLKLFSSFSYSTSPSSTSAILGYVMVPFKNATTGKTYCPTSTEFNGTDPLLNVLGDYMDDTEGIYLAEKEVEVLTLGNESKQIYGLLLARETTLKNYGFYVENGLKIRISPTTLHTKTVHFYWPTNPTSDPLIQGTRKLFTVKSINNLSGQTSTKPTTVEGTTDKRVGCIPKTSSN